MTIGSVLTTRQPAEALRQVYALTEAPSEAWDETVREALSGDAHAVQEYVGAGRALIRALLVVAHDRQPDVVQLSGSRILINGVTPHKPIDAMQVLELAIPDAPLSPWGNDFGLGGGTALALLSRVRTAIPGGRPLRFPADLEGGLPDLASDRGRFERFRSLVWDALRADASSPLLELKTIFDLDHTETARLFGVTRQAIGDWLTRGVPPARAAKLVTLLQIGRLLEYRLRPHTVPGAARKPSAAYGNRTMLELMAADEHEHLLEKTRKSFDFSATA